MKNKQPDVVLIGDSILGSSIDPRLFAEKAGARQVEMLWNGGAASAAWYLLLKNYVVPSGIRPRLVGVFFRDRLLTDATFRTTPTYRRFLESIRHEKEPVFRAVLEGDKAEEGSTLSRAIDWLYPLNDRRHVQQEKISRLAFRVASIGGKGVGPLRRRVNETFDVAKLRDEIMPEASEVSGEKPEEFTADPRHNFLPHLVGTARQAGIPLCFVREKRHPSPDGTVPETAALRRYVADLRRWLEDQGCAFVDLTSEPTLREEMYLKEEDDHTDTSFPVVWAGVFAFAVQIYADFSGYTDIARGTARLLRIDLMVNFNHPYLATSPADFWRRWHISLSTWLRDFIYIPLGGSRCSTARASFNLMATFTLSGLWHGASWNYVLWGVYWGLLILGQRFLGWLGLTQNIPWSTKVAITFCATCAGWLLFRERNLGQIAHDLAQSPLAATAEQWRIAIYFVVLVLIYALPLGIHMLATGLPRWQIESRLSNHGRFALETGVAVLLLPGIVTIRRVATSDFIYFQF